MQPDLTLAVALRQATELLAKANIDAPKLTAEVLLAHALGKERSYLYAHSDERLTELAWIHYGRWLNERLGGKPTQYITRKQEFYGREFVVSPDVLIPRPETEHVVERALELGGIDGAVIDVGTGSGCIAITLALEMKRSVFGIDIGPLDVARENARRLGADAVFLRGDLLTAVRAAGLVVTNPPYVPAADVLPREVAEWEPRGALFSGIDGLDAWRRIVDQIPSRAWLVGEIDSRAEGAMRALLRTGWDHVRIDNDLSDRPRVVSALRL